MYNIWYNHKVKIMYPNILKFKKRLVLSWKKGPTEISSKCWLALEFSFYLNINKLVLLKINLYRKIFQITLVVSFGVTLVVKLGKF